MKAKPPLTLLSGLLKPAHLTTPWLYQAAVRNGSARATSWRVRGLRGRMARRSAHKAALSFRIMVDFGTTPAACRRKAERS